ncbi:MAG: Lrp/AsnC family transcriptional regulator [Deltaproteobacteria bacterium]|nr:Lrp/AsnC family transcriptional regulator [Deltaproteobacteria bacterium]
MKWDPLDWKIVNMLQEDGRISTKDIAKKTGVTDATVRNRIKRLIKAGDLKIMGLINPSKQKNVSVAIIGINLSYHELNKKAHEIANLKYVNWVAISTGRYDLIVEITFDTYEEGILEFLTKELYKVGDIRSTETFLLLKNINKWVTMKRTITENKR